ncbi:unnamed protein product [Choristocarpus tenellus]
MSNDPTEDMFFLRDLAYRMVGGIELGKYHRLGLSYHNLFKGQDAVEWLIADPRSGATDLDGAIQIGQRLVNAGFVCRVTRKIRDRRLFGKEQTKREFRGGSSLYRFDRLRISPYHLHVIVRRATDLRSMDLNGKNDPFVKLRLGDQNYETKVKMTTNNPVWNQHFVFGVDSVESQQLHLEVHDYDRFKHDDLVGLCRIGLSDLPVEAMDINDGRKMADAVGNRREFRLSSSETAISDSTTSSTDLSTSTTTKWRSNFDSMQKRQSFPEGLVSAPLSNPVDDLAIPPKISWDESDEGVVFYRLNFPTEKRKSRTGDGVKQPPTHNLKV